MFRSFLDDDPFFRSAMQDMNDMTMMGMPRMSSHYSSGRRHNTEPQNMAMSPFGMFGGGLFGGGLFSSMGMGSMMRDMENNMRMMQHAGGAPGSSFQSSYTSISYGGSGDGQPRVYQSSSSTKIGPNGVKETQKSERDSASGLQKMAIGHHIGERSHVIEKSKNSKTGDEEESQEFINLDEDEAEKFNEEFQQRVRRAPPNHYGIAYHQSRRHSPYHRPEPAAIEYHQPTAKPHRSQRSRDYRRSKE